MNGLLRRRPTETWPRDPMEGPLFPNVPGPPPPKIENVSQPDNTMNALSKLINIAQALKGQPVLGGGADIGQNALIKEKNLPSPIAGVPTEPWYPQPSVAAPVSAAATVLAEPSTTDALLKRTMPAAGPVSSEPTPEEVAYTPVLPVTPPGAVTPISPARNVLLDRLLTTTPPVAKEPGNSLLDYWKQPVIGKMPLDQFVQLAGMVSHALAPREAAGRVGAGLAQIGGAAYAERVKREDPENVLRKRLLEAQIGEAETPKEWGSFYKEHMNTINPKTGKTYTVGETLKKFHEAQAIPKEPTPQYEERIVKIGGVDKLIKKEVISGKEYIVGDATGEDIRRIVTGKTEPTTKYQKVGETDKGLSLGYDSTTNQYIVTLKDGTIQPFDENIHGKKIEKETKVPSLGNIAEIAIGRKFVDPAYLTDPEKHKEALKWLATEEGSKELKKTRDELTAPAVTFLQTAEGFIPATTKGEGIGTVGKPTGLGKPLPSEMITTEQQIGTLKETLGRVKKNYDPAYVGFVAGRLGKFGEKTIGVGEKASSFYSDVAQLRNTLIYLMSGKQINEQEYKRLTEQMPVETMPVSTFNARMKNFEATLDSIIKERQKGMGGYGKQGQPIKNVTSPLTAEDFFKKKGIE